MIISENERYWQQRAQRTEAVIDRARGLITDGETDQSVLLEVLSPPESEPEPDSVGGMRDAEGHRFRDAHPTPEQAETLTKRPQHEAAADEIVGIAYRLASMFGDEDAMTRIVELSGVVAPDAQDTPQQTGDALAVVDRIEAKMCGPSGRLNEPVAHIFKSDLDCIRQALTSSGVPERGDVSLEQYQDRRSPAAWR